MVEFGTEPVKFGVPGHLLGSVEFGVPGSARKCSTAVERISQEPWGAAWAQEQCSELPLGIRMAWAAMFNSEDLYACLSLHTWRQGVVCIPHRACLARDV